jgi:hypothetical protein
MQIQHRVNGENFYGSYTIKLSILSFLTHISCQLESQLNYQTLLTYTVTPGNFHCPKYSPCLSIIFSFLIKIFLQINMMTMDFQKGTGCSLSDWESMWTWKMEHIGVLHWDLKGKSTVDSIDSHSSICELFPWV